jgi:peptide/nickel transport system substrate-binding protein
MRIKFFTSVVCIASLVLFAACGGDEKEVKLNQTQETIEMGNKIEKVEDAKSLDPSWRKENVLVFHTLGDPGDMHPTNGNTAQRQEITLYTQVFLTNTDFQKLDLYPQLAAAKPEISADGLEYIYALKDYLKWDDGSPITAEDVAFSFKANVCPLVNNPQAKPYLESI